MSTKQIKSQKIAVTGGNGFIGSHCVIALLEAGFEVVAIVRDPTNIDKTQFLKMEAEKLNKSEKLSFKSGDLLKRGSYDNAFLGCYGVLHTAAVVDLGEAVIAKTDVVKPAIDGTINVLSSVKENKIERFVNMSSVAAVISMEKPIDHIFVGTDWNTWSTIEKDAYGFAKTEAEKIIWADDNGVDTNTTTVVSLNPSIVLGPCFTKTHMNYSTTTLIKNVLVGTPTALDLPLNFVDARDVAICSVRAFTKPKVEVSGKRFILNATESIRLNDPIKKSHPWAKGSKASLNPTVASIYMWLGKNIQFMSTVLGYKEIWGAAYDRQGILRYDSSQSEDVLGIDYRSIEDTCRDTANTMKPFLEIEGKWAGVECK